ncbi:mediator of RNA polymerase II transcription subunit 17-like isoform X1 [Xenia sp. Carnegie-2017]|uniref:mediator of RNA polymerase II transcription subunit 17-like isoform X1 n=1 Tax=Xenia sp. Carnegie-2017 TaxID=2897299 RepID=UPI001F04AC76|nr:mediator of RNA polymerase II transcription subunit 17-like isoform X1 [Xenia sp. Carnegie-2017]
MVGPKDNMASSIPIAVEQLLESRVQEISRDGQETHVPQLSMSEELAHLAQKIDFTKTLEEEEEETDVDKGDKPLFQPSLWPWDSVRNKLRNTLTNLCVLVDILNVAREKKYISLDTVSQMEAPPKPAVRLLSKRKNFADASKILIQGMQNMAVGLKEQQGNVDRNNFYAELMKLRKHWRLKKSGDLILGDLSYKSAGSRFWHSGAFEVKKDTNTEDRKSSLDVNISTDLRGVREMQVKILHGEELTYSYGKDLRKTINQQFYREGVAPWHQELCIAQNNLYVKELFAQLVHECYHSKGLPKLVLNNEIKMEIFPQTIMSITQTHQTNDENEEKQNEARIGQLQGPTPLNIFEFTGQILLRQQHRFNYDHCTPRPVTSGIAMKGNKKICVAGPSCMVLEDFNKLKTNPKLLDKLINIAKHHILTRRVDRVIQDLSEEISDPLISCHWSSLSTETSSFASVCIGLVERMERTCLAVKVDKDTIHVTRQDGLGITLSADVNELKETLKNQVQLFMLEIAKKEALRLGWNVRCNNFLVR